VKKILSILFVLALVLSFSLVATTPVAAQTTYFVAITGDDSHTPAQAQNPLTPWATIQHAVATVPAGSTIIVEPGVYTEAVDVNVPNLTLKSSGGRDVTTIHNPNVGLETPGIRVQANLGTVTVEGFTVNYFRNGIIQGMSSSVGTAFIVKNNKVIPENNDTSPYLRNGIQVSGEGSQVIGNYVVGAPLTSTWASSGIGVVNAKNVLVEDNIVNTGGADIGISILNYSADLVENITVHRNTVIGAGNGIRFEGNYWAGPPWNKKIQDVVIDSNVVSGCERGINHLWVTLGDITITNNHIHDSSIAGVRLASSVTLTGTVAVNYNSIEDNNPWGLLNETGAEVDATLNWWDDASGPFHDATNLGGKGDEVSDNVVFMPWLVEEDGAETTETNTGFGAGASAGTTNVSATAAGGAGDTTVTVGEYVGNPTGVSPGFRSGAVYIDVHVGGTLPSQLVVEVACPGGICSGVVLQWWDGDGWESVDAPTSVVNGKIQFVLSATSSPTIAQLTGTILGLGGLSTVGWEGSSVDKVTVMAPWIALLAIMMAGATLLVVRRQRAQI
jgi:hypothetical protein